jgi:hypothetical protein
MEANIWPHRIDILGANLPKEAWEPLLNELRAEHVPSLTPTGKRLSVFVSPKGRVDAVIYRTAPMPDEEIARILEKRGIPASICAL